MKRTTLEGSQSPFSLLKFGEADSFCLEGSFPPPQLSSLPTSPQAGPELSPPSPSPTLSLAGLGFLFFELSRSQFYSKAL